MNHGDVIVDAHPAETTETVVLCEVAGATYAINSADIEHLEMVGTVTPVPNAPAFVEGVSVIRGRVVPVMDLRRRFGFPAAERGLRNRIVVARNGPRSVGLIVDAAREFLKVPIDAVQPVPDTLSDETAQYLRGIAHSGDRLILLMDVGRLIAGPASTALHAPESAGAIPAAMNQGSP